MHGAVIYDHTIYLIGGYTGDQVGMRTMCAIPLPLPYPWIPAMHSTFPPEFKKVVHTLLLCGARTGVLTDDALFYILALLPSDTFRSKLC